MKAFTLVEMLLALLVVSIILSASLPVISSRQKAVAQDVNQNVGMPVGGIILWTDMETLPDNTWLECDGSALPTGIEYEQARRVFGEALPDLRDVRNYAANLNDYLANDHKTYIQTNINTAVPTNMIGIWGTTATIPTSWAEATEYRGLFLRGHGSVSYTQNNGSTIGNTATTHASGDVGVIQGDAIREIYGSHFSYDYASDSTTAHGSFSVGGRTTNLSSGGTGRYDTEYTLNFRSSFITPTANEIRPVNKAVKYIKHTALTLADIPSTPNAPVNYRYIAKVRY